VRESFGLQPLVSSQLAHKKLYNVPPYVNIALAPGLPNLFKKFLVWISEHNFFLSQQTGQRHALASFDGGSDAQCAQYYLYI
jgi:hypothetical protein